MILVYEKITDKRIRKELIPLLEEETNRVVEEVAIPKRKCLADVVRIDGSVGSETFGLHGYEIKSEVDSLKRLPLQVEYYGKVFKTCTLVVSEILEEKALEMIPEWWGVIVVCRNDFDAYSELDGSSFTLLETREAKMNPNRRTSTPLLRLLWKNEMYDLGKKHGVRTLRAMNRQKLRSALNKSFPFEKIQELVIQQLLERTSWKEPKE